MIEIANNYDCSVALWRQLERTRQMFGMQYRRFCIRRVLVSWFGSEATDDFIWEVCFQTIVDGEPKCGLYVIPAPSLHPRMSREFLRAVVTVKLGIGMRKVDLPALDRAYSEVFPNSTPINVAKKKRRESSLSFPSPSNVTECNVNKKRRKPP